MQREGVRVYSVYRSTLHLQLGHCHTTAAVECSRYMHYTPILTFTPKALLNPLAKNPPKGAMREANVESTREWSMAG